MKPQSLTWLVLLAATASAFAGEPNPPHYSSVPASPDGIGKVYMGREIAKVMTYHGAEWLERAERVREERPDLVLAALEVKPGVTVADIGAGTGYYSRRIAGIVGGSGTVFAVEIQPEMLRLLQGELAIRNVTNVKPVLGTETDPRLPPDTIDLALMVDVYHELEYPYEMLVGIVRALKPGGHLVFVEFKGDDPRVPIKKLHTMSEQQVRKEAAAHPLEWVKTVRELPWQYVIVFRKKA
jgi:ubiquinone/menaquinone biosynthesis C-methylase UbiE